MPISPVSCILKTHLSLTLRVLLAEIECERIQLCSCSTSGLFAALDHCTSLVLYSYLDTLNSHKLATRKLRWSYGSWDGLEANRNGNREKQKKGEMSLPNNRIEILFEISVTAVWICGLMGQNIFNHVCNIFCHSAFVWSTWLNIKTRCSWTSSMKILLQVQNFVCIFAHSVTWKCFRTQNGLIGPDRRL